jgi:enoyl-CoA hydratase/carnithine racemase
MYIETEQHDGYTEVILNRPERRNAIIQPLAAELRDTLRRLATDTSRAVILLRGAGGSFSSGLDLREMNADPAPAWRAEHPSTWRDTQVALFECPQTVVCALERYAINAGAALALGCDLMVAGDESYLQVAEVQQGVAAPMNLAWLRARFSEHLAARIALSGRRLLGPELVTLGIALQSVPEAQVLDTARTLCAELAGYPPAGLLNSKSALRALSHVTDPHAWFSLPARHMPHTRAAGPLPRVR